MQGTRFEYLFNIKMYILYYKDYALYDIKIIVTFSCRVAASARALSLSACVTLSSAWALLNSAAALSARSWIRSISWDEFSVPLPYPCDRSISCRSLSFSSSSLANRCFAASQSAPLRPTSDAALSSSALLLPSSDCELSSFASSRSFSACARSSRAPSFST